MTAHPPIDDAIFAVALAAWWQLRLSAHLLPHLRTIPFPLRPRVHSVTARIATIGAHRSDPEERAASTMPMRFASDPPRPLPPLPRPRSSPDAPTEPRLAVGTGRVDPRDRPSSSWNGPA